ncbi:hypothetical protein DFJ43DRAFT_1193872 [Lentinula guzmanii]|uniref:Nbr1 FW domain-containing protein n=1 Tax=Lentinula guzmanii TaxID=2804957 RepID=A0AA38N4F8_9AGAR|nr:hypothetical protein DFJ43DRAFT_1193872 [Lentinula guzmanii]
MPRNSPLSRLGSSMSTEDDALTNMERPSRTWSRLIIQEITDGQVIAPGAEFLKAWVMRNGGSRPWPEGTELVFVAGESFAKDNSGVQPQLRDGEGNLFGHSIWLEVSETSHTDSPDTLASSEGYLSSSSIMVMPQGPSTPSAAVNGGHEAGALEDQSPQSSVPVSPMTAPSAHSVSDEVDISDNDSVTSGSLLSVPDSDSDEELWQDSRTSVFVERQSAESQTTLRETQQPDEYVVRKSSRECAVSCKNVFETCSSQRP